MRNSTIIARIPWIFALAGLVPAIVALILIPFDWWGLVNQRSLDPWLTGFPARYVYGALLVTGAGLAVFTRQSAAIFALLPLLLLAVLPIDRLSVDRSLLDNRPHPVSARPALDTLAASYKNARAPAATASYTTSRLDVDERRLREALAMPALVDWFGLASGAREFARKKIEDVPRLRAAMQASPLPAASVETANEKQLLALAKAINMADEAWANYSLCLETPSNEINEMSALRGQRAGRCGEGSPTRASDADRKRHNELAKVVAAEQAARGQAIKRATEAAVNASAVFDFAHALEAAAAQARTWFLTFVYACASLIALALFAWNRNFRSTETVAAVLIAIGSFALPRLRAPAAADAGSVWERVRSWLDTAFDLATGLALPILMFAGIAVCLRLLALGAQDNWQTIQQVKLRQLPGPVLRTTLLWIPLLVVAAGAWYATNLVSGYWRDAIYEIEIKGSDGHPIHAPGKQIENGCTRAALDAATLADRKGRFLVPQLQCDIEKDLDIAVEAHFEAREAQFRKDLDAASARAGNDARRLREGAVQIASDTIPQSLDCIPGNSARTSCISPAFYGGYSCGWIDLKCRFVRGVKRTASESYSSMRGDVLASFTRRASQTQSAADEARDWTVEGVKGETRASFEEMKARTKITFWTAFRYADLASMISLFLLIFTAIKGYLYIFARVLFNPNGALALQAVGVSREPETMVAGKGTMTMHGDKYRFRRPGIYLVPFRRDVPNTNAPISWPHSFKAVFVRLWTGHLPAQKFKVERDDDNRAPNITTTEARSFVELQVPAGRKLFFHFRNVAAMSSDMKLTTVVSMRWGALFFGRIIFYCVEGPGIVVLETRGRPNLVAAGGMADAVRSDRILAWDAETRFRVASALGAWEVYLSDVKLQPDNRAFAVIDADTGQGYRWGALRYIGRIFRPLP